MAQMANFYASLPTSLRTFYIKGYSEAFSMMDGVRVVPSIEFLTAVPYDLQYLFQFKDKKTETKISFPMYYVPIKKGRAHYGFFLKSGGIKSTPSETWWKGMKIGNLDALYSPHPYVVLVEGFKDAYLFLKTGIPVVIMAGATVSFDFIEEAKSLGKTIVHAGDNDEASWSNWDINRDDSLINRCKRAGVPLQQAIPTVSKDWGAVFDVNSSAEKTKIIHEFQQVYNMLKGLDTNANPIRL